MSTEDQLLAPEERTLAAGHWKRPRWGASTKMRWLTKDGVRELQQLWIDHRHLGHAARWMPVEEVAE